MLAFVEISKKIKVGEYRLHRNNTPTEILDKLISSDYVKYQITIPEGHNIFEIAKVVDASGLATEAAFLKIAQDSNLATKTVGEKVPSFEGFLFPETYHFSKTDSVKKNGNKHVYAV